MPALLVAFILLATATPIEPWPTWATATRTVIIRGTVMDSADARPIASANVYVNPGQASTIAGIDGSYMLRVPADDTARTIRVRARAVGYAPAIQEVAVGDTITLNFTLRRDVSRLEQVVVTSSAVFPAKAAVGMAVGSAGGVRQRGFAE